MPGEVSPRLLLTFPLIELAGGLTKSFGDRTNRATLLTDLTCAVPARGVGNSTVSTCGPRKNYVPIPAARIWSTCCRCCSCTARRTTHRRRQGRRDKPRPSHLSVTLSVQKPLQRGKIQENLCCSHLRLRCVRRKL